MPGILAYALAAWLLLWGIYGIATSRNLIHMVNCLVVLHAAGYTLLLGIGYQTGATAPIQPAGRAFPPNTVDPIVQALTLTDIVVGAMVLGLLLAVAVQGEKRFKTMDPEEIKKLGGQ
jgi:multicomponent Na+:H+ antiporter subunit C